MTNMGDIAEKIPDIIRAAAASPASVIASAILFFLIITAYLLRRELARQNIIALTIIGAMVFCTSLLTYFTSINLDNIENVEGDWESTANGWVFNMRIFNDDTISGKITGRMELTACPILNQCPESAQNQSSPVRGEFDHNTRRLSFTRDFETPEAQDYIADFANSHVGYGKFTYNQNKFWFAMVRH